MQSYSWDTPLGYLWLQRRFFSPRLAFDPEGWRKLFHQALPIGGAIVFSLAYTRTAVFVLDALEGAESVGFYGVAHRLVEPLALVPAAVMAAVFPALTESLASGGAGSRWLRRRSVALLAALGASIALAGVVAGPGLLGLLYGAQYAGSQTAFQILAASVVLSFVNYALTHFLIAQDRQVLNFYFNLAVFAFNLALCIALVPRFGPAGAAAAVVASEALLLALCWAALRRGGVGGRAAPGSARVDPPGVS